MVTIWYPGPAIWYLKVFAPASEHQNTCLTIPTTPRTEKYKKYEQDGGMGDSKWTLNLPKTCLQTPTTKHQKTTQERTQCKHENHNSSNPNLWHTKEDTGSSVYLRVQLSSLTLLLTKG